MRSHYARLILTLTGLLLGLASTSGSAAQFTGPGWYVVTTTMFASSLEQGPVGSENECKAVRAKEWKPDDDENYEFMADCRYFAKVTDLGKIMQLQSTP
jgi:hypothetical protein